MFINYLTYYFNILCDCFSNDEPKSPEPYKREIIDTFRFDEDDDIKYTRYYKKYDHTDYNYL